MKPNEATMAAFPRFQTVSAIVERPTVFSDGRSSLTVCFEPHKPHHPHEMAGASDGPHLHSVVCQLQDRKLGSWPDHTTGPAPRGQASRGLAKDSS